ncbi:Wzz/FepE/Etk N-terminal domain-containing protein, partial [Candidatus Cyanaurora vandensis]
MDSFKQTTDPEETGIGLLDVLIILTKYKKLILGTTLGTALVVGALMQLLPDSYTAETTLLPPQENQSSTS